MYLKKAKKKKKIKKVDKALESICFSIPKEASKVIEKHIKEMKSYGKKEILK